MNLAFIKSLFASYKMICSTKLDVDVTRLTGLSVVLLLARTAVKLQQRLMYFWWIWIFCFH